MFNYDQFLMKWELHVSRNVEIILYALSDLELYKMALRALDSRNFCRQQHSFLMRGLGDIISDGHDGDSMLPRIYFGGHKKLMKQQPDNRHQFRPQRMVHIHTWKSKKKLFQIKNNLKTKGPWATSLTLAHTSDFHVECHCPETPVLYT
jgi:hypothetical protein